MTNPETLIEATHAAKQRAVDARNAHEAAVYEAEQKRRGFAPHDDATRLGLIATERAALRASDEAERASAAEGAARDAAEPACDKLALFTDLSALHSRVKELEAELEAAKLAMYTRLDASRQAFAGLVARRKAEGKPAPAPLPRPQVGHPNLGDAPIDVLIAALGRSAGATAPTTNAKRIEQLDAEEREIRARLERAQREAEAEAAHLAGRAAEAARTSAAVTAKAVKDAEADAVDREAQRAEDAELARAHAARAE